MPKAVWTLSPVSEQDGPSVSAHKTCNEFGLGIRSHIKANLIGWFHPERKNRLSVHLQGFKRLDDLLQEFGNSLQVL
jgi:hypothetical protein